MVLGCRLWTVLVTLGYSVILIGVPPSENPWVLAPFLVVILPTVANGGWYLPNGMLLLAPVHSLLLASLFGRFELGRAIR